MSTLTEQDLISKLKICSNRAQKILDLISEKTDPQTYQSVRAWTDQCYNEPARYELVMKAIDEILETCGVEALFEQELPWGDNASEPFAVYCNVGDSYASTIVYMIEEGEYIIAEWADVLEEREQESDKEAEGTHRAEILEGMIEIFWAQAWTTHVEEVKCENLSGVEITEVMPEAPEYANELAEKAAEEIIAANSGCSLDLLYRSALRANINEGTGYSDKTSGPVRFGNCLAYKMIGSGVSWSDDNADCSITVPYDTTPTDELFGYAEEHCENCHSKD